MESKEIYAETGRHFLEPVLPLLVWSELLELHPLASARHPQHKKVADRHFMGRGAYAHCEGGGKSRGARIRKRSG